MRTTSQVAKLTGVSVRTLQYYDEIGLLSPSKVTSSGYRLYDDEALENLQQILFFRELGFKLKEIKEILQKPDFDKTEAYRKQKNLLCLKRRRIDRLIALLEKLEKGEPCMSFEEFDLSEYIEALEDFKINQSDVVIKHWGSTEAFDKFIERIKDHESQGAKLAVRQYGSIKKYTEAMKFNLDHFSELMEKGEAMKEHAEEEIKKSDDLYFALTADMTRDFSSREIQNIVHEIVETARCSYREWAMSDMPDGTWDFLIEGYLTHNQIITSTDEKFGSGASQYIGKAFQYYFYKQTSRP